jgi:hypothetical protein
LSGRNHLRQNREWNGIKRGYYAMPFDDRYISTERVITIMLAEEY